MLKKGLGVALIITVLGAGSLIGCRAHRHSSPEAKINYIAEKISDELELDETQQIKFDQIKEDVVDKFKEVHAKKHAEHSEIIAKIKNDEINRAYFYKLAAKKEALHKELKPFIIDRVLEFYDLLKPEQKKLLAEKLEKLHDKYGYR